ncbi:hypothetical protein [Pedobacter foliorum]|uniref:hypothetical protein n=1 Tax=Pedobacter foliorum TaxID=2739058 RepID=UPI001566122F|nr:hypothetical protein [Pedobacter foliorum]NRF37741.1 hypothetical protein [Pedobacter foliorum]
MKNKTDEMRLRYGLKEKDSILSVLDDFWDEDEVREYCWQVLHTYPDLNKEDWIIGIEGGDFVYSFAGNFVLITDDIWSFNLVGKPPVLALLTEKMKQIRNIR